MDNIKEKYFESPMQNAGFLSRLLFLYTLPTFKKGLKKVLDVDDIYTVLTQDRSASLGTRLERNWNDQLEKYKNNKIKKPSLPLATARTFWAEFGAVAILCFMNDFVVRISSPIALKGLLSYYEPDSETTKTAAIWYAAGIVALNFFSGIFMNQFIQECMHTAMKARAATCALIYRKSTKLSKVALGSTPVGKIVNLLANDVSRFEYASYMLHQLWVGPLATIVILGMLYNDAGWAGITGVGVIILVIPIQLYTSKLSATYRKKTAMKTDERIRLMDEILLGVQVIKMYAWEKPFAKLISTARSAEVRVLRSSGYIRAFSMLFNIFITKTSLFCTLVTVALSGEKIVATNVFVYQSYFNILSQTLAGLFVTGLSEVAELLVSFGRIQKFLMNEEYDYSKAPANNTPTYTEDKTVLALKNVTAKWDPASSDSTLEGINFNVERGKLIGIIGPVGAGKSSILQAILGELYVSDGTININGYCSYASQEPWIFPGTIRQNILFGESYHKDRYKEVIKVCNLEKDFRQFERNDLTIIGDKGASLSGGQKARINLARAVYRDLDIYLFDDPLSAVDIHVSKVLYEQCINGFLRDKTRVLVTHQVHYLKNADEIIILNNGKVEMKGTFNELANSGNLYAKLLTAEPKMDEKAKKEEKERKQSTVSKRARSTSVVSALSEKSIIDSILADESDSEDEEGQVNLKDMQEESSRGKVKGSLMLKYLFSGANVCSFLFLIILLILAQLMASLADWYVSYFTKIEETRNSNDTSPEAQELLFRFGFEWTTINSLYVYASILVLLFVFTLSRSIVFYTIAMTCSKKLHAMLFNGVIDATMRFFDTNPSGRVLNRFSKDIGQVDEAIPKVLIDALQMFLQMLGALILIMTVNPYPLILMVVLSIILGYLRNLYLKSSKNIKRVEGILRSPIFTHLTSSIQGITTIRAFRVEETLIAEFDKTQDYHSSSYMMYMSCISAFGFLLDQFSVLFNGFLTMTLILWGDSFGWSAGEVGMAISQSQMLMFLVQYFMRITSNVVNSLMSVERVLEYKTLTKEPQPEIYKEPPKGWPGKGKIEFDELELRYFSEGPLILKDLTFTVQPREKVGIVGRTGAGKSSLIQALFRLAVTEGSIRIDGVDTSKLNLETLRSRISIIPQDPVLFSGTLRYNLDPFDEYTDDVLYNAINDVELKDPANIINRLENRVMDKGSNYSVGQRQLICLARAIVRRNKVLLLDEATANVDPQTDALIQRTIRNKFADCTVLTIAHRLNTIMDSDKVLVMDFGNVAEFDHPYILLQKDKGIFREMVEGTGPTVAEELKKIASDAFHKHEE